MEQAYHIDIDKDGYVDQYDIETFQRRYKFIEEKIDH